MASALPPDWEEVADEASGKVYFWNTKTDEVSWDRPAPAVSGSIGGGGGGGSGGGGGGGSSSSSSDDDES